MTTLNTYQETPSAFPCPVLSFHSRDVVVMSNESTNTSLLTNKHNCQRKDGEDSYRIVLYDAHSLSIDCDIFFIANIYLFWRHFNVVLYVSWIQMSHGFFRSASLSMRLPIYQYFIHFPLGFTTNSAKKHSFLCCVLSRYSLLYTNKQSKLIE